MHERASLCVSVVVGGWLGVGEVIVTLLHITEYLCVLEWSH